MGVFQRGSIWWFKFKFAGQTIRETTKSASKTVAREAEKERRRELERGFNNDSQAQTCTVAPRCIPRVVC